MGDGKSYKIMVIILLIAIVSVGWLAFHSYKSYEDINKIYQDKVAYEIFQMRSMIYGADINITKTLVALDKKSQFNSILDAKNYISKIGSNKINYTLGSISYGAFWGDIEKYFNYLLNKNGLLNSIERENLRIIREHLGIIKPTFDNLEEIARRKEWERYFVHNERVKEIFSGMEEKLNKLPNIGENDGSYKESKYGYVGHYSNNIFKDEKKYSKEELSKIAKNFMGRLWEDDLEIKSGGEGSSPLIGRYITYNGFKDNKMVGSYQVQISVLGGHIISAESLGDYEGEDDFNKEEDRVLGPMDKEKAINYGKALIDRWNEENLKLYNLQEEKNKYIMVFAPAKNNINLTNRSVEVIIEPNEGRLIGFNANDYFIYYGKEPPTEYTLSQEEVLNNLYDEIEVIGTPKLEVIRGKSGSDILAYSIPVKGIKKVEKIYINAMTGGNEGMVYENRLIN